MDPQQEEKKIRELFQQLKREDERLATPFATAWEAAVSRMQRSRRGWRFVAMWATSVVLALGLGISILYFNRTSKGLDAMEISQSVLLMSQWQSPTEFLLNTPGRQFLASVPQLGERFMEISALAEKEEK